MAEPGNPFGGGPPGRPDYGPRPGEGPPPFLAAPAPPRPQGNLPVLIALVAVGLMVIGGIVVALAIFGASQRRDRAADQTTEPEPPPGRPEPGAGPAAPACVKAVACCRKLMAKANGSMAGCDALRGPNVPTQACEAALGGYRDGAKALGVKCD